MPRNSTPFLTLLFCLCLFSAHAESSVTEKAELYSWRTAEGTFMYGLRIGNDPSSFDGLINDKKYQIQNQKELEKAFEKLGPGTRLFWRHLNPTRRLTRPPEEIEVETKESALKAQVILSLVDEENLEPEYWNQPRGRYEDAVKKLSSATTDNQRLSALRTAAKEAFLLGLYPEAKKYALDLEILAPKLKESENWNYGDAVQDFNIILGRVAIAEGDLDTARGCLLGAGYSPGSPVMNSLGPDMSLARDLLAQGDRKVVLQYLDLCRNFWKTDHGLIDQWSEKIKVGGIPDFGTNIPK